MHNDLRKNEIVNACMKLYDKYQFKDITMKLISEETSFSRPSIYNYFETKEEIFLALFAKEYDEWSDEVKNIYDENVVLSKDEFARKLAYSMKDRERLLKLLSMNMYDLEENSRMERLIEFKKSYKEAVHSVKMCLEKFFPEMSEENITEFLYSFFPFMFGIYPYTVVTDKQRAAMEKAEVNYKYYSIYDMVYMGIRKLLGWFMKKVIFIVLGIILLIFLIFVYASFKNNKEEVEDEMIIRVSSGDNVITFELNDSKAAKDLYSQLPLDLEVSDFSTNEKVFYPEKLDASDAPFAKGGKGVLAYYEPWGDVVMFYDDFSSNNDLYELGKVIDGVDMIENLSGNIVIEKVEG